MRKVSMARSDLEVAGSWGRPSTPVPRRQFVEVLLGSGFLATAVDFVYPVLRNTEKLFRSQRHNLVGHAQHISRLPAQRMISSNKDRTGKLFRHAVMVERGPVCNHCRRYELHGDHKFMELRRTVFTGRERHNGKPSPADASYPALTLKPLQKLRRRIILCMPQYLSRKSKRKGRVRPCLGKKHSLPLPQLAFCYILHVIHSLYSLSMAHTI